MKLGFLKKRRILQAASKLLHVSIMMLMVFNMSYLGAVFNIGEVKAAKPEPVTICHATESLTNPFLELHVNSNALNGHFEENGTPNSGHEDDLWFLGDVSCPVGCDDLDNDDICDSDDDCISSPEICDGIDNDCDGAIDEELTAGLNSKQLGVCLGSAQICTGAGGWQDDYSNISSYGGELCDGLDNDCNGKTDEDLRGPMASSQEGECDGLQKVCAGAAGWVDDFSAHQTELCDGKDNDCDGLYDEDFYVGSTCNTGIGACQAEGQVICTLDGASACDAVAGEPGTEICANNIDDDCDGTADEGCSCIEGAVASCEGNNTGECKAGVKTCENGVWSECRGVVNPTTEVCGNELDEDCNGFAEACDPADCDYSIQGFKYNGIGEGLVAVQGFSISLYKAETSEPFRATSTDEFGRYYFDNLCEGDYIVREEERRGWRQVYPYEGGDSTDYHEVTLPEVLNVATIAPQPIEPGRYDFVNEPGICGYKYNGLSEERLPGWTILLDKRIYDETRAALVETLAQTETDDNGEYCFYPPESGDYIVREVMREGWELSAEAQISYLIDFDGAAPRFQDFYNQPVADEPVCGNNEVELPEVCDEGELNGQAGHCNEQCNGSIPNETNRSSGGSGTAWFYSQKQVPVETESGDEPEEPTLSEDEVIVLGEEGEAALSLTKSVNKKLANPGETLSYTIVVKNTGNLDAFNVVLKDILPEGISFKDANLKGSWAIGDLSAGASKEIRFDAVVSDQAGEKIYSNLATAAADNVAEVRATADVEISRVKVLAETGLNIIQLFTLSLIALTGIYVGRTRRRAESV